MKITNLLDRFASGRNLLILLLFYLVFPLYFLPKGGAALKEFAADAAFQPLDLHFGFSPEEANASLTQLGEAGRSHYKFLEITMDVFYPLAYGFFFAFLISFTFRKAGGIFQRLRFLAVLPLIGMLFDYMENAGIVTLINAYPEPSNGVAQFASFANLLKWGFIIPGMLAAVVGLAVWCILAFRKKVA